MNLFMAIDPDVKGQILTFDFHNPSAGARKVAMPGFNMERFNPLGLSAYEGRKTGKQGVFNLLPGREGGIQLRRLQC